MDQVLSVIGSFTPYYHQRYPASEPFGLADRCFAPNSGARQRNRLAEAHATLEGGCCAYNSLGLGVRCSRRDTGRVWSIARPGKASAKSANEGEDRPAYAETDYPHRAFGWSALRALRSGKYLYIQAPERELYNQSSDPEAAHNLAGSTKAVAGTMAAQLDNFRQKTSQTLVELAKPDPEQMKQLQALGYVGSNTVEEHDDKKLAGVDPKTKIEISNLLHDAMFDVEDARYQDAIPLLERVLKEQPEMPVPNMQYGIAEARLRSYDKANRSLAESRQASAG